jgi:hypothetical protein
MFKGKSSFKSIVLRKGKAVLNQLYIDALGGRGGARGYREEGGVAPSQMTSKNLIEKSNKIQK